jgi:hypothetical protein
MRNATSDFRVVANQSCRQMSQCLELMAQIAAVLDRCGGGSAERVSLGVVLSPIGPRVVNPRKRQAA